MNRSTERVLVDSRYAEVIHNMPHNVEPIVFSSDKQLTSKGTIFLWRQYMLDRPIKKYVDLEGYNKRIEHPEILGGEYLNRLDNFDKIYDNHGVLGYYLTGVKIV